MEPEKSLQDFTPTGRCPVRDDISHRMLTVTLRTLETDGMIRHKVYAEVPPRVEYGLTERGGSLLPHIFGLVEWAQDNMEAILGARRKS